MIISVVKLMSNPDQLGCYALIIVNVASTSFDNIEELFINRSGVKDEGSVKDGPRKGLRNLN